MENNMDNNIDNKTPKKKKKGRVLTFILVLLAIGCLVAAIINSGIIEDWLGQKKYDDLSESVKIETTTQVMTTEEETEAPYVSPIDFDALKERNPDVIGWVTIPNTQIDYPILWNGDNDFYLHHDIDNQSSAYGAIYLDGDDKPDFSSLHNITYGHHMKNGSMYQNIVKFKDEEFFKANRDVYVYTPDREFHLKTMACLYTDASGEKRITTFADKDQFDAYVDKMTDGCKFREVPPDGVKQLWSFVTCSYEFSNARTILYCYEIDEDGNKVEPDEELYKEQATVAQQQSEDSLSE